LLSLNREGALELKFNYPLLSLNDTAWEIFKNRDAFNNLDYQCIYDLESCYQVLNMFQNEFDKSHINLQTGKLISLKIRLST